MQLRYSDDGGENYKDWRNLESGGTGHFLKEMVARRLGMTRHRIWEFQDTSPVAHAILSVEIEAE